MRNFLITSALMCIGTVVWAQKPQLKVDFSFNKSASEVSEPDYEFWIIPESKYTSRTFSNGIECTLKVPEGASYTIRPGWNKTFVGNADYKALNARLTGDGASLNPATTTSKDNPCAGEIILTLKGLPVGTHTLQTYHNRWENPEKFAFWPINVKVGNDVIHEDVATTYWEPIAANACMLTTMLNVEHEGDSVSVSFYTVAGQQPTNADKTAYNMAPVIDGFELNTVIVKAQAKEPCPNTRDLHVDCDNKTCLLQWTAPGKDIVKHLLYIGSDSASVAQMTAPTAELTDTCYTLHDIYSMNTYYWRVDEVDKTGVTTQGNVWYFRPRHLAFPGAEGYGRFATGGRGGIVYHVTNLSNDMTPGSFLYGLKGINGPRTIVFDVSGVIQMCKTPIEEGSSIPSVFANPYLTIAAQTAPGKGICLKYCNISITTESIVRHMRFKRGFGAWACTGNAVGMNNDHTIMDHCTAAWGTDETLSTRGAKNITFQYSMIAEALTETGHKTQCEQQGRQDIWHGYAATIDGQTGSYSHNMLVNCEGRNWSMGGGMSGDMHPIGSLDMRNNVCYNWYSRTTDGGCHQAQFVGNYYKMGPDTRKKILFSQDYENIGAADARFQAYIYGNIRENKDHSLTTDKQGETYQYTLSNGATDPNTRTEYQYKTFVDEPFFESYVTTHTANDAFKIVTSTSGATMPCRDNQHRRVMNEAITGTTTYVGSLCKVHGEIDTEADITGEFAPDGTNTQGWEFWPEEHRAANWDTDQDGMPDWWETAISSDPYKASNNDDPDHDGWTLLEDYINFIAHPYVIVKSNATTTFNAIQEFRGFTKSPVFSVSTDSNLFTASVSDSVITVSASSVSGVGTINMTVKDSEGSTYTQPLGVVVSDDATAITAVYKDTDYTVAKREIFTLDGKRVSVPDSESSYIIRDTDTNGKVHTYKGLRLRVND